MAVKNKKIILIGETYSKRTDFFLRAAKELGISVNFYAWSEWKKCDIEGGIVKIDPPSFKEYNIMSLPEIIQDYKNNLYELEQLSKKKEIHFLNSPSDILQLLDKSACKKHLSKSNITVTEMITDNLNDYSELKELMLSKKIKSVFVKPMYGSGAAGIIALSLNPANKKILAYTAAVFDGDVLFQQKRIRKITDEKEIEKIVNAVASLGVIVERWYSKAALNGNAFDFRVVWQFGCIEYIVARKSSTPITNLHLNNGAVLFDEILERKESWNTGNILNNIEQLCNSAMMLYPNTRVAGLDVMLDKKSGKPRIIEINGQGDLLYQDIYKDNLIYRNQIIHMNKICDIAE